MNAPRLNSPLLFIEECGLRYGFATRFVLSRIQRVAHTPSVGLEKPQKIVIFWTFLCPPCLTLWQECGKIMARMR